MAGSCLNPELHTFDAWRSALALQVQACREWLIANDLGDAQTELRLTQALARINHDHRTVLTIVAEDDSIRTGLLDALALRQEGAPHETFDTCLSIETAASPTEISLTNDDEPASRVLMLCIEADPDLDTGLIAAWKVHFDANPGAFIALLHRPAGQVTTPRDPNAGLNTATQIAGLCAHVLGLEPTRVLILNADQACNARRTGNPGQIEASGIAALEGALAVSVNNERRRTVGKAVRGEIAPLLSAGAARLDLRRRSVLEQLRELEYLRGKNQSMVDVMMQKVSAEKENLDREISSYQALRSIFSAHTNRLFTHLGMDALAEEWRNARDGMQASMFTNGVRSAMTLFFRNVRHAISESATHVAEISTLMAAMYRKFSEEHGSRLREPTPFTMNKYVKEIDRLEALYTRRFNTPMAMLTNGKSGLMHKFSETLASRVKQCYEYANREVEQWLRAIMAPMETELKEHQAQFMRRLESIKRIHRAISNLEERIAELIEVERGIRRQADALAELSAGLEHALVADPLPVARAA